MSNSSTVLDDLQAHLREVEQEPTTSLNVKLLEQGELFTSTLEFLNGGWKQTYPLFFQLGQLLPTLQQDPSPLIRFVLKLTAPYSFDQVKELDFATGLDLKAEPFHLLILSLLEKATGSGNDAENVASRSDVVQAIVRLWLCTDDTGTAIKASNLLIALLKASKNLPGGLNETGVGEYGRGPMWKRLFDDKDIYSLLYLFCSLKSLPAGDEVPLSKRDTTVAQARLMEWLPKVGALDWDTITKSHHPEIETKVGLKNGEGLLHFASMKMVDFMDDILMHINLINFFSDLISTVKAVAAPVSNDSSVALEFLKQQGWHAHIIKYQQDDTPSMEQTFLKAPAANYISVYASTYPDNFGRSTEAVGILDRLSATINKAKPEDFHILASVPRASLVPQRSMGYGWDESPILSIPVRLTNPDALKTLATIFHGPIDPEVVFPPQQISTTTLTVQPSPARHESERIYARLLLSLYLTKTPSFFTSLIHHADTIAMKETALAALLLLRAIITSKWSPATSLNDGNFDAILARLQDFPGSGIELILDPTISGGVLPFLLKPATSFSGLVGGRGDAESAAFQIAMAKFDTLKALGERVKELQPPRREIDTMIRRRVAEGPWGVGGDVGARIGTMEL